MKKLILVLLFLNLVKAEAQTSALSIADSLFTTEHYAKAINYYAKDGTQKGNLQIARAYHAMGNYDKAITQYVSIIDKNPELQIASFELGKLYLKTKRFNESRKLFTQLVKNDAKNAAYLYYQGESFRELELPERCLTAYKRAIAIDSTHLKSLFRLSKYFVVQQETNEALKFINKGLRFYANDVSFINLKGLAHFNNDEYEQAIPFFEQLLVLGERKPHIYGKLAYCYFKVWELEKAKKMYYELIALDETNAEAYFNLGHVFLKDKQIDSAKFYIKKSIEVQKPIFNREYKSLANIAREQNDLKTAFDYCKRAFKEEPSDFMTYFQICTLADQLLEDPKMKLQYYENFINKFGENKRYFSDRAKQRVSELKEEIHFAVD